MKTDDLIDRLARDATVVTPLPAPAVRTGLWLVWALLLLRNSHSGDWSGSLCRERDDQPILYAAAGSCVGDRDRCGTSRIWIRDSWRADPRVGSPGVDCRSVDRRPAVGSRHGSPNGCRDSRDESDRLAVRRFNASGWCGPRGAPHVDVARWGTADAACHHVPGRLGGPELGQHRSLSNPFS